jgi:hypothetical protein
MFSDGSQVSGGILAAKEKLHKYLSYLRNLERKTLSSEEFRAAVRLVKRARYAYSHRQIEGIYGVSPGTKAPDWMWRKFTGRLVEHGCEPYSENHIS